MVVRNHSTPRSVFIKDENQRIKRRNFIDVKKSKNEPNFIAKSDDMNEEEENSSVQNNSETEQ